ncbi:CHASE2 domain-containing protein [uncultured Methylobacterium sp.]|uniref:CHASE2 domain-containing protein n=1 Tax=uncultured Methylobacterium sp. TaxID=157278 RepID=UPI0035CA9B00
MQRLLRRATPALLGIGVVAGLLAARIALPDPFERVRLAVFDTAQRAAPRLRVEADSPVRIIDIDDASLARLGQWPWPRSLLAGLVGTLQDMGAASIALDMVFSEPDRTSPARLAQEWQAAHGWRLDADGAPLPDHDRMLAETIGRGRVVLGYGLVGRENGARPVAGPSFALIGPDPRATVPAFAGAVPNLAILDAAGAGHGSFAIAAGRDEIVRRLPLISARGTALVPALSVEALRVAQGEDTLKVRAETTEDGAVTGYLLRIGTLDVPLDREGAYWLHHAGTLAAEAIPAWRLLDPRAAADLRDRIAGRIVLVGTSATGLSDLRPTPLNAFEPGVAIHAEAIEQMVSGLHPTRPAWAIGAEGAAAAALALLIAGLAAFTGLKQAGAAALALPAAVLAAAWLAFTRGHLLLDPSLPVMAMAASFGATSLTRHLLVERDASRLKTAFTHYLSPDLVQALARDPDRLKLGGETRPMTFLFTDLEGFTAMTESRGAEALVSLLNAYLDGLCGVAMAHGGTVDKIVGDAVHVMFNAPLDQPDHAARAVACALAIDAFAVAFAAGQRAQGVPFGATRIGVNTGPAVVGNFGGTRRFDYTAHGDAINTAARLEAANKALGTRICVAGTTVAACPGLAFRPIGSLTLRGKTHAVPVFDPLPAAQAGDAFNRDYLAAFARLDADGDGAAIETLHEARPDDPVVALHARRLRAGERSTRIAA